MIVWGIDPGNATGIARFEEGALISVYDDTPVGLYSMLLHCCQSGELPDVVVVEDSRKTKAIFKADNISNVRSARRVARSVGMVDARCADIEELCTFVGVRYIGVSPKAKGAKLNSEQFKSLTGWKFQTNQHGRDAAMVAWPYRSMRAEVRKAA